MDAVFFIRTDKILHQPILADPVSVRGLKIHPTVAIALDCVFCYLIRQSGWRPALIQLDAILVVRADRISVNVGSRGLE
ncbi:hypothetical protein ES703_55805 [subsurface metagenome]